MTPVSRRTSLSLIAIGIGLWSATATAYAGSLFTAAPPSAAAPSVSLSGDLPRGALIAERRMVLDADVLASAILPPAAATATDRAATSAALSGKVTIELFAGVAPEFAMQSVDAVLTDGIAWNGTTNDGGQASLVILDGQVTGAIDYQGRHFLIDPVAAGTHRLREVRQSAYPKDIHVTPAIARPQSAAPAPAATTTTTVVTLYAVYSSRAKTSLVNPGAKIALDVQLVNTAMVNSKIPIKVRLLKVDPVAATYNELSSSNAATPLYDVTNGTQATFKTVRATRATLKANLVTFYTMRPEYCGIAWVLTHPTGAEGAYGFSSINSACTGSLTLAHELGHNMGLHHDRYVEPAAGNTEYNYGYVNLTGRFMDVMSYYDLCSSKSLNCSRIANYSSPLIKYNGLPTGIAQGKTGAADNARALTENRSAVAKFH